MTTPAPTSLSFPRDPRFDVIGPACPKCGGPCYVSLAAAMILCVSARCAWATRAPRARIPE